MVINNHQRPYLVLEEVKQRELLQKVAQLKLGDWRLDVKRLLGASSCDRADWTKEGRFIGWTLVYYLEIWEKDLVNEKHDSFVRLEFDTDGRLTKIIQKSNEAQ